MKFQISKRYLFLAFLKHYITKKVWVNFWLAIFESSRHFRKKHTCFWLILEKNESEACVLNAKKILISKFDLIWPDMELTSANGQAKWRHNVKWTSLSIQNGPDSMYHKTACDFILHLPIVTRFLPLFTSRLHNS